jgi:hypothetical protein
MDTEQKPVYRNSAMNLQARRLQKADQRQLSREIKRDYPQWSTLIRRTTKSQLKPQDMSKLVPGRVVEELNSNPGSASAKRVARFLELYNRAKDLNDSFRLYFSSRDDMIQFLFHSPEVAQYTGQQSHLCTGYVFKVPEIQVLNEQLNRVLVELNSMLRKYKWSPVVRHMGFEMSNFDITEDWPSRFQKRADSWEFFAIWWLCNSRNARWIEFLRRCPQCDAWFFAAAAHQIFCRDACRKQQASKSPEFKERRALYMRKYRRQEKATDELAKRRVGTTRGTRQT